MAHIAMGLIPFRSHTAIIRTYDPSYQWVSEGLQTPLQYVGDRARVKLIVPFKRGTYYDQSKGLPVYYEILEYIFEENL